MGEKRFVQWMGLLLVHAWTLQVFLAWPTRVNDYFSRTPRLVEPYGHREKNSRSIGDGRKYKHKSNKRKLESIKDFSSDSYQCEWNDWTKKRIPIRRSIVCMRHKRSSSFPFLLVCVIASITSSVFGKRVARCHFWRTVMNPFPILTTQSFPRMRIT